MKLSLISFRQILLIYCLLILGSSVGCRFANKTFNEVAKNALHSFVAHIFFGRSRSLQLLLQGLSLTELLLLLSYCPGGKFIRKFFVAIFFDFRSNLYLFSPYYKIAYDIVCGSNNFEVYL